jgi:hypothetical protein
MIEWVVLGAAVLGAGGLAVRLFTRSRAHHQWAGLLAEVAQTIEGRASPASRFDDPELRAEVDGVTVTLRLVDIHKGAGGRVEAQARLLDPDETARVYLGWDVLAAPADLAHVPEVPYPNTLRVQGTLTARADQPVVVNRLLEAALLELTDVRREANARQLEVVVRGGYLTLLLHGLEPTAHLLVRALRTTASLAHHLDRAMRGTSLAGPGSAEPTHPPPQPDGLLRASLAPGPGSAEPTHPPPQPGGLLRASLAPGPGSAEPTHPPPQPGGLLRASLAPGPGSAEPTHPPPQPDGLLRASLAPGPGSPQGKVACELCGGEPSAHGAWVRCRRCGAPYHAECFQQATACLREECGSVHADPFGP